MSPLSQQQGGVLVTSNILRIASALPPNSRLGAYEMPLRASINFLQKYLILSAA
jgi:hypothetical protein